MIITFKKLVAENFKCHQDIEVNFGERTDITGDNGLGKSSTIETLSYVFYGTDTFGSKLDPVPITYKAEETKVSLLLSVDDKDLLLARSCKKGKTTLYINEVPTKATEYSDFIDSLFSKELFLSLFNPSFFFTLHWEKQRATLLQYIAAPINKEILKHMMDEQKKCLEPLLKKNSLTDIEKIHKDKKVQYDKKYIQAQTRTKTLREQLNKLQPPSIALDSVKVEMAELVSKRNEVEKITDSAGDNNYRMRALQDQINRMLVERDQMKKQFVEMKNESVESDCPRCKQSLTEEAKAVAIAEKQARLDKFKEQFNKKIAERNALEAELKGLTHIDITEQIEIVRGYQKQIDELEQELRNHSQYNQLDEDVKQAETDEQEVHKTLKETIFVLDCIKAFKAKQAELQAEKVQALFDTLSVRLFKKNKTDGELKPDFEIEMDGKPYSRLSLSESIRAGLELREVLSKQSEIIMPVFVDNAESITRFKGPTGQLIVSRVVAGQELKIEGKDAQ